MFSLETIIFSCGALVIGLMARDILMAHNDFINVCEIFAASY